MNDANAAAPGAIGTEAEPPGNNNGGTGTAGTGNATGLSRLRRFLRYTGVNLVTVTLDYAIFLGLTHIYDMPTTASVIAYLAALVLNYWLSKRFVFGTDGSHKSDHRLFLEFTITGLLGLVITAAVTGLGVHYVGLSPAGAKTIAVLICFVVLYAIRSRLVFTPRVE